MKPESENTRAKIKDVALEGFTQNGFRGISVREIVEKAGVSKPTLYYYFKNKEDLYLSLIRESFTHFNGRLLKIAAGPDGTLKEKLLAVTAHYLDFCRRFPREVRLSLMSIYRTEGSAPPVDLSRFARPAIDAIAGILREVSQAGEIKKADPVRLALQLLGMIHIQILIVLHDADFPLPLSTPEELVDTFLRGVENR